MKGATQSVLLAKKNQLKRYVYYGDVLHTKESKVEVGIEVFSSPA